MLVTVLNESGRSDTPRSHDSLPVVEIIRLVRLAVPLPGNRSGQYRIYLSCFVCSIFVRILRSPIRMPMTTTPEAAGLM